MKLYLYIWDMSFCAQIFIVSEVNTEIIISFKKLIGASDIAIEATPIAIFVIWTPMAQYLYLRFTLYCFAFETRLTLLGNASNR